jgi:bifunctional ADP-heptose synthase (sugar kinase/adenylyltransferase)
MSDTLKERLLAALPSLKPLKAVVVGDDIMDVYIEGATVGYANKTAAPVVRRVRALAQHAGGSRAVARHMDQFCDNVKLYMPPRIVYKERYVTDEHKTLVELLDQPEISCKERKDFLASASEAVAGADVAVCLDYGHGAFKWAWEIPGDAVVKVLNVQSNSWSRGYGDVYGWLSASRIDLLVMDENELRETLKDREAPPEDADEIHCPNIVTMGHRGLRHSEWGVVPAHKVAEVDRTGAGDAALAMAALMTAAKQPAELVAHAAAIMGALKATIWGNERAVTKDEYVAFVENIPA